MWDSITQSDFRRSVFEWIDRKLLAGQFEFTHTELKAFEYRGERIPLLDTARGIRNPVQLRSTLSLMTSFDSPYDDLVKNDGFVHYAYQAKDGGDNTKVFAAERNQDPIVYFHGVRPGVYTAHTSAYVVAHDEATKTFLIALDESFKLFADPLDLNEDERRYSERITRQRLHQPMFRARVMHAYDSMCAVCQLRHPDLLDAAHILDDGAEQGLPVVSNGLALCKLHHAAYDRNLLGINPDYEVHINAQLRAEVDGPMLLHGLQDMHGRTLSTPSKKKDLPSKDSLAMRYEQFAI